MSRFLVIVIASTAVLALVVVGTAVFARDIIASRVAQAAGPLPFIEGFSPELRDFQALAPDER